MKKIKDLAVKIGSYTDRSTGKEKGRYQNIGSVLQNEDGSKMMLLNRWFNPAGVPFAPGRENSDVVLVSMFDIKKDGEGGGKEGYVAPANNDPDDSIPF